MARPFIENRPDCGLGSADFLFDLRDLSGMLLESSRKPQESQLDLFPPGALDKLLSLFAKRTEPAVAGEPNMGKISESERFCSRILCRSLLRKLHESPLPLKDQENV